MPTLHRLTAFSADPSGGNPAGVHVGEELPPPGDMQRIAAEVGYSETAFLAPLPGGPPRSWQVRYFAPAQEVDFCGHATIASGVLLDGIEGPGAFLLHSNAGPITVDTVRGPDGTVATLTSPPPRVEDLDDALLDRLLAAFGWTRGDLDPDHPPAVAFAGVWHPVIVLADRQVLAGMAYPFDVLRQLMVEQGWTTVQAVTPTAGGYAARNPFPVGGVVEDAATGAAAAAFGAYLRHHHLVQPPAVVHLVQGEDMGRRSDLTVHVPVGTGGIGVAGTATALPEPAA